MKKLLLAGMLLVGMAGMAFSQENYLTWSNYRNITLNTKATGANITTAQVNFPVLVRLNANDSVIFSTAQTAGQDIRFTNASGKHLPYQIEQWNAAGRTAAIWVLTDTVKANDSIVAIKMYWRNAGAADSSKGTAVFDATKGFAGVWHLNNSVFTDATSNAYTLTNTGTTDLATGMVGGGRTLNGTNQYLRATGLMGTPAAITFSAWVNITKDGQSEIVSTGDCVGLRDNTTNLQFFYQATDASWPGITDGVRVYNTGWKYVVSVCDPTNSVQAEYINGVVTGTSNTANIPIMYTGKGTNTYIGRQGNGGTNYLGGSVDEVRIENVGRSADWIKLNFANQVLVAGADSLTISGPILPTPTGAPTLLTPANAATGVAVLPTLTWGTVTGALTYRVQVSAVSDFSTIAANDSTPTTGTYTLTSPLSGSSTYYWRANAKNLGGPSVWSSVFSFTTVSGAPAAPALVVPANAAINVALAPTLTWGTVPGALTYRVQLSTISTFASTVADDSTLTVGTKAITGLAINTMYFWRANAKNIGGTSGWSSVFSFTTVPAAPAAPVLSAPVNAATGVILAPTLTWGTVTGAVTYRVQLSTISTFATTVVDDSILTAGTKAVTGLANAKTYYWRANAKNAGGSGAWSSVFSFTTKVLAAPALVSPANSAILTSSSVTLVWGTVADAITYRLQVSSVSTFATTVFEDSTLTSAGIILNLPNGPYFWRLSSKNDGGFSAWSTVNTFTISASGVAGVIKHYSPTGMGHNGILAVYRANGVRVMELAYGPSALKSQLLTSASRTLAKGYYTYRFCGKDANVVIVGKLIK